MMDRSASSLGETAGNIVYMFLPEMKEDGLVHAHSQLHRVLAGS